MNSSALATQGERRAESAAPLSLPQQPTWIFAPTNATEALAVAEMLSRSNLVPDGFRGKPGDVLIALQMGAEVGLAPMQALQGIAVINGRPSIWGDTLIALVRAHPSVLSIEETLTGAGQGRVATCKLARSLRGAIETTIRTFSWADAERAGLSNKQGPWKQYPERMLQMRARGFALRDGAADILKGLAVVEEAMDIGPAPVTAVYESGATKSATVGNALEARVAQLAASTDSQAVGTPPDFSKMKISDAADFLTETAQRLGVSVDEFSAITKDFGGSLNRTNAPAIYERIVQAAKAIAKPTDAEAPSETPEEGRFL